MEGIMARTKRSAKMDTRNARMKLETGKMYQEPMARGRYLCYRRPPNGAAGNWFARMSQDGNLIQSRLGSADDHLESNGTTILAFAQAQAKAGEW